MQKRHEACYVACMHDKTRVARVLREISDESGLSQEGIGALAGVNRSTVNRWMNEHSRPEFDQLRLLSGGIAREHPELVSLAAELLEAAGYDGASVVPDTRPQVVRDNWDQETVRHLWQNDAFPEDTRTRMIEFFLALARESAGRGDAEVTELRRANGA
jgi:transcriptional regulator with XRE-family HTH domain